MDLSVFHPVKSPDRDYTWKDKLNGITSPPGCRFLEWSGWYNQDVSQRLLGHYRLYQLFKAKSKFDSQLSLPLAYITHYATLHRLKYWLSCITAVLYYIFTLGDRYHPLQVEELNKQLIHHRQSILQEFLASAEVDFEIALSDAIDHINEPEKKEFPKMTFVSNRLEHNIYNNTCHYFTEYKGTNFSGTNDIKGKQPGTLTKKQILIFFDLLAEKGGIEKIDYSNPKKFESVVELLHALNGKSKSTWEEELKNHKNKGLYYYNSEGELNQLIKDLTSLSNITRKSGFRTLAKAVDKKIMELERLKNNNS